MTSQEIQTKVTEVLDDIFDYLEIKATYEFNADSVNKRRLNVQIDTDDANVLIGYHGETLNSLQNIVNTILYRQFKEEGVGVVIDISGYRKEREEKLIKIAKNASDKAKSLNKSIALYPMNSYERRLVHTKVSEIDGVSSESDGEGRDRRVIIRPD